jgi:HAMP domain-containing protein
MLANLSLRNKFLITTVICISLLGLAARYLSEPVLKRKLYDTLIERGVSIAKSAAFNSEHFVLEEQHLLLSLALKDYQSNEHDIRYIFAANAQDEILAHTFDQGFPRDLKQINKVPSGREYSIQHLLAENGEVIDIAVPLMKSQLGSLHVGLSGEKVRKEINSFLSWITSLLLAILAAGGGIAIVASRLITRPLDELARAAQEVAAGDLSHRVTISSADEIGQLKAVFNDMVEKRQQRELEREKMIGDLQKAFAEIRVLSGMLPICASCKKIRDDKGYWNQLESYIRDHSEAEFTHGICPECVRQLYPEIAKKE